MSTNPTQERGGKSAINKQILEIKKKIQLSDGQRKALFEEYESLRKANADEIIRLKKEISQLAVALHDSSSIWLKNQVQAKRLQSIIGPLDKKTSSEAKELLDLQIINKKKKLDVLNYWVKKRQRYLSEMASEYQALISDRARQQITEKIDNPVKKSTSELQNSIHAVRVQHREAVHVCIRYRDIKKALCEDAARFESNIQNIEDQLRMQNEDIGRLQEINDEASRMRSYARGTLLQEEREALSSARLREKQAVEGKKLVDEHRQQLERLERRIFQVGKTEPTTRAEAEAQEQPEEVAAVPGSPGSPEETPPDPRETLAQSFETLKQATGATSISEVLEKFRSQKETLERLMSLRKSTEEEKLRMERRRNALAVDLDRHKFTEAKDTESNLQEMERVQKMTVDQREKFESGKEKIDKTKEAIKKVEDGLQALNLTIHPNKDITVEDASLILQKIEIHLQSIMGRTADFTDGIEKSEIPSDEENWLPPPYNSLIRRSPLPLQGTVVPQQPGSDDEEEVPSRVFLKRQAQLVVDAKTRRKNMRVQLPYRK